MFSYNLKTDYAYQPLNVAGEHPLLSWWLESTISNDCQTACRVLVATAPEQLLPEKADCWDSGVVSSSEPRLRYRGVPLDSFARVYWTVAVRDAAGSWSDYALPVFFACAPRDESDWAAAQWIGAGPTDEPQVDVGRFAEIDYVKTLPIAYEGRAPYLRRVFTLMEKPLYARLDFCGLGSCALCLNGKMVSDEVLGPARTDYRKRVLFQSCDISELLKTGENCLEAVLGNGWFNPAPKWWSWRMQWYGSPRLRLMARFEYANGRVETLASDGGWRFTFGAEQANCLYDGSEYDARLEPDRRPDTQWLPAHVVPSPGGAMEPERQEPEKVMENVNPLNLKEVSKGVWIADFGQEISGWLRIRVHGPKGHVLKIRFAEALNSDGTINTQSNTLAGATDRYTLAGDNGMEVWEPRFVYHGFRYAELSDWPGTPDTDDVTARNIRSNCPETGHFLCSDALLNRIFGCAVQSLQVNFHGFPGDCAQRDERQGWIGDAHVIAPTALYCFDLIKFYRKYLTDIADAETDDGRLPFIAPWSLLQEDMVWSSGIFIIAWQLYLACGDAEILKQNYNALRGHLQFLDSQADNGIQPKPFWGDHLCLEEGWDFGLGIPNSMSTAFYCLDTSIMAKIAAVLGDVDESRRLADRAKQIAHAFVKRYYDPATGQIEGQGQSAAAMALSMVPMQSEVSRHVLSTLLDDIFTRRNGHLSTGLISTAHLIDALDAAGCNDELWRIIHKGGYPGWADMLSGGLTSIPEDWQVHKEPRRSRCHVPLGAVALWFFRRLAGLQQSDDSTAYASLEMRPYFPDGLHWVEASLETIQGRIASTWHRDGNHVTWHITLPLGTNANLVFPKESHRPPETIGGGTHVMEFTI